MKPIKFRLPTKCQNGHFRWEYLIIDFPENGAITREWGPKNCDCPTHGVDQGFSSVGAAQQSTGFFDRKGKEVFDGDIVRVYDTERWCVCDDWEDCDAPDDTGCAEHGEHKHEKPHDCEKFICTQEVAWSEWGGYFCEEDTGEYCPALGADEIEMEIIGNMCESPELLK